MHAGLWLEKLVYDNMFHKQYLLGKSQFFFMLQEAYQHRYCRVIVEGPQGFIETWKMGQNATSNHIKVQNCPQGLHHTQLPYSEHHTNLLLPRRTHIHRRQQSNCGWLGLLKTITA